MYLMYERVAVVTHVSDEKSIKTEDVDGKLKIQVKHTYLRTQLFFSVSLFLSLPLHGAEEVPYTHTHSLSPVFAFPRPYRIHTIKTKASFLVGK